MDKSNEEYMLSLYAFRTRHLIEFSSFYEKALHAFDCLRNGSTLNPSERTTFKEYAILRDIALLAPYVNTFDDEMLKQLPAEKIKNCKDIVDFLEGKINQPVKNTLFSAENSRHLVVLKIEFVIRIHQFVLLEKDFPSQEKPRLK